MPAPEDRPTVRFSRRPDASSRQRRAWITFLALSVLHPLVGLPGALSGQAPGADGSSRALAADTTAVSEALDAFHQAASRADGERYFGLFAEDGVFIGTDATERWTVPEFREYARPYFEGGQGWTYVPTERHVHLSANGATAWFEEMLRNEGLGLTRGTGVLVREEGSWKVAQYHLTIPVPNAIVPEVVEMIQDLSDR